MPIYMKIEGITGQATEDNHKQWIECLSFSSPIERSLKHGAYGNDAVQGGQLVFGNIHLTRKTDSSSVPLAKATSVGKVHPTIEIHVTTPLAGGEKNLLEYKLSNAVLTSHSIHVTSQGGSSQSLDETVEVNFSKIQWVFRKYKPDGSADGQIPGGYDRPTAKEV